MSEERDDAYILSREDAEAVLETLRNMETAISGMAEHWEKWMKSEAGND